MGFNADVDGCCIEFEVLEVVTVVVLVFVLGVVVVLVKNGKTFSTLGQSHAYGSSHVVVVVVLARQRMNVYEGVQEFEVHWWVTKVR